MLENRSMPSSGVIPVLAYPDVVEASKWLCAAFGFRERLLVGSHRVQLHAESGAVVIAGGAPSEASRANFSVMIRVADAAAHFARAKAHGATIISEPTDYPYGERQYSAQDLAGYVWTFSQTVSDVDPASWGGVLKEN
ncbi:VOC family protein [Peristeroidobacter soli]|uniref:VOC family protein n=1 Tax=Peristeroidobacter soli TaxID=2497877 RepID=UPI00101DB895|nr:VOC family protein [Peristeroidobacter soli]